MAQRTCPQGHAVTDDKALFCPACGQAIRVVPPPESHAPRSSDRRFSLIGIVLGLLIFVPILAAALSVRQPFSSVPARAKAPAATPTKYPCRAEVDDYFLMIQPVVTQWADLQSLAGSTSRIALSNVVGQMQAVHRDAERMSPPSCADFAHKYLLKHMSLTIDGMLAFMAQEDDDVVNAKMEEAAEYLTWFREQLERMASQ